METFKKSVIILAFILGVLILLGLGYENYLKSNWAFYTKIEKVVEEKKSTLEYGNSSDLDNRIKELAHAKGWNLASALENQVSTNNRTFPYFLNKVYVFQNPANEKEHNVLDMNFIYSEEEQDWIMITTEVYQVANVANKNFTTLDKFRIWDREAK